MTEVLDSPVAGLNLYITQPGPITFGYLDATQYSGELTWVAIDTSTGSSWTASTVYYGFNGVQTSSSAGQPVLMGKHKTILRDFFARHLQSGVLTHDLLFYRHWRWGSDAPPRRHSPRILFPNP